MLLIRAKNQIQQNIIITWHIGSHKFSSFSSEWTDISISADNDELRYILNKFINIPINKDNTIQCWRGEFARFILENL